MQLTVIVACNTALKRSGEGMMMIFSLFIAASQSQNRSRWGNTSTLPPSRINALKTTHLNACEDVLSTPLTAHFDPPPHHFPVFAQTEQNDAARGSCGSSPAVLHRITAVACPLTSWHIASPRWIVPILLDDWSIIIVAAAFGRQGGFERNAGQGGGCRAAFISTSHT